MELTWAEGTVYMVERLRAWAVPPGAVPVNQSTKPRPAARYTHPLPIPQASELIYV